MKESGAHCVSMVLYCLVRRNGADGPDQFLVRRTTRGWTFPPTKFRDGEDLYSALVRPMEQDIGLPAGSYYPEIELQPIENAKRSLKYAGLTSRWYLYPVDVSITGEARAQLDSQPDGFCWMSLDELAGASDEPNVHVIVEHINGNPLPPPQTDPSMDALASAWCHMNQGGVRIARDADIRRILSAGGRAFNLRVADPYLPYQRQGLGFTWSFFTPKDKQDVHVHGMPAVEVYGVFEGHLQVWHKPMNQRGVRTWHRATLGTGDWLEVDPLHCHFAFWVTDYGLGTVFKAAGEGELGGVGRIGEKGKTICKDCPVHGQCQLHPAMLPLVEQYARPFVERDYSLIARMSQISEEP